MCSELPIFVNISKTFLEKLPIKKITIDDQKEIIKLVKEMLDVKKKLVKELETDKKETLEQEARSINQKINAEIYKIYEIDSDTIEKVESNLNS